MLLGCVRREASPQLRHALPDDETTESSAARRAYFAIIRGIADGEYPPGSRLGEESLAQTLEMSRTPVREALRRLAAEGLVEISRNRGARIASWTAAEVEELFELRVILEGYAARLAATNADDEDIDELRRIQARFESAIAGDADVEGGTAELNNQFHSVLTRATKNRQLIRTLSGVAWAPLLSLTFAQYRSEDHDRSISHHRELIEAVAQRDADWAELAMQIHIRATKHSVLQLGTESDAPNGAEGSNLHWLEHSD
jgi:DNA-binding GntR family transcriptional regulator